MDVLVQVNSESSPLAFDLESQTDGSYLLATSYFSEKAFNLKTYRFLANQTFEIPASDYNSEYQNSTHCADRVKVFANYAATLCEK